VASNVEEIKCGCVISLSGEEDVYRISKERDSDFEH
jgi:hypothetical protein